MDDVDQDLFSMLKDNIPFYRIRNVFRYRSMVRLVASLLPIKPIIRPFSQIDHGIIIYDNEFIAIEKHKKQYSDDFNTEKLMNTHHLSKDNCDLYSDWSSNNLFDVSSLKMPPPKNIINRTTICNYESESAIFSRDDKNCYHGYNYDHDICSQNADERIDVLENELNSLRSQLAYLTMKQSDNHESTCESIRESTFESIRESIHESIQEGIVERTTKDGSNHQNIPIDQIIPPPPPKLPLPQMCTNDNNLNYQIASDLLSEIQNIKLKHVEINSKPNTPKNKPNDMDIGEFLTESLQQKFNTISAIDNSDINNESTFSSINNSLSASIINDPEP